MIRSIIDQVLPDISALNFADRVAGIVTAASQKVMAVDNTMVLKTCPIYQNTPVTCESGDYILCVPDEKFKSIIYFEEISNVIESQSNYDYQMSADVRLVGWFNLKKINQNVTADTLMRLILQSINENVPEFGGVFNVKIRLTGFENKSPQIFSAYTYDEAETQYLLFPYDYGSLRFTVTYRMNKCVDDIEIIPNCGKK